MAWPDEAGAILGTISRPRRQKRRRHRSMIADSAPWRGRFYAEARGKYRIFNAATYRFYWSNVAPPSEGGAADETNATLPYESTATFADGTWWLSVSYFNGIYDSGFLPIGPAGETYLRLDIDSGGAVTNPPRGPLDWRVEPVAGGYFRVIALYFETGDGRADEWAIAYSAAEAAPPGAPAADAPDATETITGIGLAVLDWTAEVSGTHEHYRLVRLQTRRNDGTVGVPDWNYSEDSETKQVQLLATGPDASPSGERWLGYLPEDL